MTNSLDHAVWAYSEADRLAAQHWPYVFGGGHPIPYGPPSSGGFDCSGWASHILWHGGLLEHQGALNTTGFESWGLPGRGQYVTLWVIDEPTIHHCFLEFEIPGRNHHWSAASHSGTICGWQDHWGGWITAGYSPRHPR